MDEISDLKKIQERLKTQNNRATKDPIFIVYDYENIPGDPAFIEEWEYVDCEDGYSKIGTTKQELIDYAKRYEMDLPDDIDDMDADDLFEFLNESTGNQWHKIHNVKVKRFRGVFSLKRPQIDTSRPTIITSTNHSIC